MCLSFWIFSLYLIVYYFNIIFSEALKSQESSTCLHSTPYSVSQTPTTIFMETIRFLMKVNAVQVRIFGIGQVEGKILMNYLFCSAAAAAESLQSCPTLCDPIDGSPPGSSVLGILQARILEWVSMSFSRGILLTQGIEPRSRALQADSWLSEPPRKPVSTGQRGLSYKAGEGYPLATPNKLLFVATPLKLCWTHCLGHSPTG